MRFVSYAVKGTSRAEDLGLSDCKLLLSNQPFASMSLSLETV